MAASNSSMVLRQRRQRRRRGLLIVTSYVVIVFALAWYFDTQATTTILFVRHADVDDPADLIDGEDPPLNATGRARAQLFADFLEHIDVIASVDAVYAGDTLRARQTAEPLAARHGLTVATADPYAVERFMTRVQRDHKGEIVLIVTDADAIAPLIEELHGSKNVAEIAPDDFDNFYIVTIPWGAKVKTLQLSYAHGWEPPAELRTTRGSPGG